MTCIRFMSKYLPKFDRSSCLTLIRADSSVSARKTTIKMFLRSSSELPFIMSEFKVVTR